MKLPQFILCLCLLPMTQLSLGQRIPTNTELPDIKPANSIETIDSTAIDSLNTQLSELNKKLNELLSVVKDDKDTSLVMGRLSLRSKTLVVLTPVVTKLKAKCKECRTFRNDDNPLTFCNRKLFKFKRKQKTYTISLDEISEVKINVKNGVINSIVVNTTKGDSYSNNFAPIDLDRINKGSDILSSKKNGKFTYIRLHNFLNYDFKEKYLAEDKSFSLKEISDTVSMVKNQGINSLINVRAYSDLLGVFGEESNGISQTELNFVLPLHRNNLSNKYMYVFSDLSVDARYSRLDSKYMLTPFDSALNAIARIDLNQRKWFNINLGLTAFEANLSKKSDNKISLDMLAGMNFSRVAEKGDSSTYYLPYFGFSPQIELFASKNFGIKLSVPFVWETFEEKQAESYGGSKWLVNPTLEAFYYPLDNKAGSMFTRVSYLTYLDKSDAYLTFQFGYSLTVSELIGKASKN